MSETPPLKREPRVVPPEQASMYSEELRRRRVEAMARSSGYEGADALDPKMPSGHAYGVRTSTLLTQQYRETHRQESMNITPQQVVDVLVNAGIKNWVLMGLHGYVGYMPDPRATQDVDILIPYTQRKRAKAAIEKAWPGLIVRELSQVVRFMDPHDLDHKGQPKPVVDLMMPWGKYQETILKECVKVDERTQHRIPTLEAALVSKYGAMVSRYRDREKKEYDAGDFRRMVRANYDQIDRNMLRRLADQIWEGAGDEIVEFVEIAVQDRPFPI